MPDRHYEYRWEDHSILLRLVREPVLLPLVRVLPTRITPNQITVFGQVVIWAGFVLAVATPFPTSSVLGAMGLTYLLYAVADCIDGEFARHTRRTSRVGELLDHGLDAISLPLVVLGFGIAMQQPAWVTLSGTAAVSFLDFATFVHGYRVGHVHLGTIGLNEGLVGAAIVTAVAAVVGIDPLIRPLAGGLSVVGVLLLAMVAGSLSALAGMPELTRKPGDFTALVLLLAAVAAWHLFASLSPLLTGLLFAASSAYLVCRLTCARLLREPVPMGDPLLVALVAAAAAASIGLGLDARAQQLVTLPIFAYVVVRGGAVFLRAFTALTR